MPIKLAKMVFKDVGKYGGRLFRFYFIKDGEKSDTMVRSYVGFLEELDNAWGNTLVVVEKVYKWNRKSKTEWKYFTAEEQIAYVIHKVTGFAVHPSWVNISHKSGLAPFLRGQLSQYIDYIIPYSDYYTVDISFGAYTKQSDKDKWLRLLQLLNDAMFYCEKSEMGQALSNYLETEKW